MAIFYNTITTSQPNLDVLYEQYYSPYPNLIDPITKGASEDTPSAYQLYELGRYPEALDMLDSIKPSEDTEWYMAQSVLAMGDDKKASILLDKILQSESHEYYRDAQFSRAMLHLKLKKTDDCIRLLQSISSQENHPYNKKAIELLKKF